jgi:hypothetical protein
MLRKPFESIYEYDEVLEQPSRPYHSTIQRRSALVCSIQLPVLIWVLCGYLLSLRLFGLNLWSSLAVAAGCGYVIFLVERLVIATPRSVYVATARLVLTVLMSALGACVFDLIVFEKDITAQLQQEAIAKVVGQKNELIKLKETEVAKKKEDWGSALHDANCEANGTCGSGVKSPGPLYRELKTQADEKHKDYLAASKELDDLRQKTETEVNALRTSDEPLQNAGVLMQLQALHQYVGEHPWALVFWACLFVTIMLLEASVLAAKYAFGETVDDLRERIREQLAKEQMVKDAQPLLAAHRKVMLREWNMR